MKKTFKIMLSVLTAAFMTAVLPITASAAELLAKPEEGDIIIHIIEDEESAAALFADTRANAPAIAVAEEPEIFVIPEEEAPLADAPSTGDSSVAPAAMGVMTGAMLVIAGLGVRGKIVRNKK